MVFAVETEDVLQAWALPIENSIGVGGFDLALAANPLTSEVGREGSLGCSASSVPPGRLRLSPIEGVSKIKVIEEGDFWSCTTTTCLLLLHTTVVVKTNRRGPHR